MRTDPRVCDVTTDFEVKQKGGAGESVGDTDGARDGD